MTLFISPSLFPSGTLSLRNPVFLPFNLVTTGDITADSEDPNHPASNLGNPQTSSFWTSLVSTDQNIDFDVDSASPIDGFGIARHNFGSMHIGVQVWGKTADIGAVFVKLFELSPGDDSPILGVLASGQYITVRLTMLAGDGPPSMAVFSVSSLLKMPVGVPTGHTPLFDAREITTINSLAESGDFLDEIVVSQTLQSDLQFKQIPGAFLRSSMRLFLRSRQPFFFARSPLLHPTECAYAKLSASPKPIINQSKDWYDLSLSMTGLAL